MRDSLVDLLEKADLAIAAASGVIDEKGLAPAASAATALRSRLGHPDDLLVAALAGGTGSGKSSLVNAIAGSETARAGGSRPTTGSPLAVSSERGLRTIRGYLEDIGIADVVEAEVPDWLCLIDLPDSDSVEVAHRSQVDELLAAVDLVIWVVDPQKYRDASLHDGYLRRLVAHRSQFVFAFNQIDRLAPTDVRRVMSDFETALAADGLDSPSVFAMAADPPAGPPIGVSELVDHLASIRESTLAARMLADLGDAAKSLAGHLGPASLHFRERAAPVVDAASRLIGERRAAEASDLMVAFLEELADEARGLSADRIRSIASSVPRHAQAISERAPGRPRSWLDRLRGVRPAPGDEGSFATEDIDELIMGPVRDVLMERASAIAAMTDLAISVERYRSTPGV